VLALKDIEQGVRFSTESIHESNVVIGELAELSEQLKALVKTFNLSDSRIYDKAEPVENINT